jgi:DNA-binding response OmpR family regulator
MPGAQVLVVDDDSAIRGMIVSVLEEEGLSAQGASNGAEALEAIEASPPRLIVLDLQMPVMDGWSLFRHLRSSGVQTPVLLISAHGVKDARVALGAEDALAKPFDIDELIYRVTALLAR